MWIRDWYAVVCTIAIVLGGLSAVWPMRVVASERGDGTTTVRVTTEDIRAETQAIEQRNVG